MIFQEFSSLNTKELSQLVSQKKYFMFIYVELKVCSFTPVNY